MSQQRLEHASKIKLAKNTAAAIAVPSSALAGSEEESALLQFTNCIWNEYRTVRQETRSSSARFKEAGNKDCRTTATETNDGLAIKAPKRSPAQSKQCKVKVTRFQYGGPKANIEGQYTNNITMTAPCLQQTCANCRERHSHLMRNSPLVDAYLDNEHITQSSDTPPSTSYTGSMILDDARQTYQGQLGSMGSSPDLTVLSSCTQQSPTLPQTPVDRVLQAQWRSNQETHLLTIHSDETAATTLQKYNTFLPISLLYPIAPGASNKMHWRSAPRQHCMVKLSFPTDKGKRKFKTLLHEMVRRAIEREYSCLRRVTKQLIMKATLMGEQNDLLASVKRRMYRVKLVFKSKEGRKAYGRLIERSSS